MLRLPLIATDFLDTFQPPGFLLFVLYRRKAVVVSVSAFGVVEHLDIVEHVTPRIIACGVDLALDPLQLEQLEEALDHCVVVAVAAPTRRAFQSVRLQKLCPVAPRKLAALIAVDQHARRRLTAPDGHQQGLQDQIGMNARLHRPANNLA